jgi:hypothetical protein
MTSFYLHRDAGTKLQVKWPERIELLMNARFDLRNARESVATEDAEDRINTQALLVLSEDKRRHVTEDEAGYLIHEWQGLRNQARRMII